MATNEKLSQSLKNSTALSQALMGNQNAAGVHQMTAAGLAKLKELGDGANSLKSSMLKGIDQGVNHAMSAFKSANGNAVKVRESAVKTIKSMPDTLQKSKLNQDAIKVRERVKENVRGTAANLVKRMSYMSNGGKGRQFNVPKPGESIAVAQKRLNELNNKAVGLRERLTKSAGQTAIIARLGVADVTSRTLGDNAAKKLLTIKEKAALDADTRERNTPRQEAPRPAAPRRDSFDSDAKYKSAADKHTANMKWADAVDKYTKASKKKSESMFNRVSRAYN